MKRKPHAVEVGTSAEAPVPLPDEVHFRLGEIANVAKEGLLALASAAGLAVLHECMEHEVDQVVGPRGRHDARRQAKRPGHTPGEVTLGGRRVPVSRPRVRTANDRAQVELESYAEFGSRDLLERIALERMLAGRLDAAVATRGGSGWGRGRAGGALDLEAGGLAAFVGRTRRALDELLSRGLSELELAVVMIDGVELAGLTQPPARARAPVGAGVAAQGVGEPRPRRGAPRIRAAVHAIDRKISRPSNCGRG